MTDTVRRVLQDALDAVIIDVGRLERMNLRVSFPSLTALIDRRNKELVELTAALRNGWEP